MVRHLIRALIADCRGSIALYAALTLPVALLTVAGALDLGNVLSERSRLRAAIDKAALAGARELGLADARRENVPAVVAAVVEASIGATSSASATAALETKVRDEPLEVEVIARRRITPVLGSIGLGAIDVELVAVARIVGRPNICVLGLDPDANGTISLEREARVTGQSCAVFSNSTHASSIKSKDSAQLTASLICAAGGKDGGKGSFIPEPLTDCPTFADPLAGRPEPVAGPCDNRRASQVTSSATLQPGTYCGGLEVRGGASVILAPGVYVVRDGPFIVRDGARISGEGVGIFLTGAKSQLRFERASSIDLAAPRSGPMAGLLVFGSRSQPKSLTHQILSDDARNLLGTIYLPTARLHVDANNPVADRSAYTAIVARMLTLYGGPHLVLNANYDHTQVPVPHGIRGASQPVSLVK